MRELVLTCSAYQAQDWSDAMLDAGALSVSIEDADWDTPQEQALYGEQGHEPLEQAWPSSRLIVLLEADTDPDDVLASLQVFGTGMDQLDWFIRPVSDTDWVRQTQAQFVPVVVGKRILIVPSWHYDFVPDEPEDPARPRIRIQLDPGMAFGTGTHATTQLCLSWLDEHIRGGEKVLDYGCGTGVLAIAAARLGASSCWAVDIDEHAIKATKENAAINHVKLNVFRPDELPAFRCDIVVANILSLPLIMLAPVLAARLHVGGQLVLSGILEFQAEKVIRAYETWFDLSVWQRQESWVCLSGPRIEG